MAKGTGVQGGTRALTPQRKVVLRVIQESDNHLTANEIFEVARRLRPSISFATVYNSLRYLKDAGLIHEISFGNGASRYDRETDRHDHAICTECGRLEDFDLTATGELLRAAARKSKFKPESIHLTLRGLCPDCREGRERQA
ncbi:MAG TPA: Fur family transcriptional regulator [Pyrinomonadaceae bacterium]|jgi:Fe2+ or Zn2+ uptake regulation protein